MAQEHQILDWSLPAAGDLSTKQFYPVALQSNGRVGTIGSTTTAAIGILQDDPDAAGRACAVRIEGVSKMYVRGDVAPIYPGYRLGINSDGLGIFTTTANQEIVATALEQSTAAGDIISVLVTPSVRF